MTVKLLVFSLTDGNELLKLLKKRFLIYIYIEREELEVSIDN